MSLHLCLLSCCSLSCLARRMPPPEAKKQGVLRKTLRTQAVDSWFIKVEHLRDSFWENTAQTYWVPGKVRDGRFRNWLESARDWAVSRSRFWGTPIPIWSSADGEELVVVSSVEELEQLTGAGKARPYFSATPKTFTSANGRFIQ